MKNKLTTEEEVKNHLWNPSEFTEYHDNGEATNFNPTGVTVEESREIDGKKYWRYHYDGVPIPRTRHEEWISEDAVKYSILSCFEHSIEQVISGEVSGPRHNSRDH